MLNQNQPPAVKLEKKVVVTDQGLVDTRYYVTLPEYKSTIIIKEEHVSEIIKQLTLLKES